MRITDLNEMREIELKSYENYGFSESLIVENVGSQGANFIDESFLEDSNFDELVFLIGRGNNGADGLAIARHLVNMGHRVRAFILFPDSEYTRELERQLQMASCYGVKISEIRKFEEIDSYFTQTQDDYFVVDAIFGTGVRLPLSNNLFELIKSVNRYASKMISIDIPSGISGESGQKSSTAIHADATIAIGLPKIGHFLCEGPRYSGELYVADGGLPLKLLEGGDKRLITKEEVIKNFYPRSNYAHKYDFGHTLIIGGSQGLTGALIMAAQAASASGAGVVTAATWAINYGELVTRISPDIITGVLPRGNEQMETSIDSLEKYDSIVIGPGLGRTEHAKEMVLELINNYSKPVVLDADALIVLSYEKDKEILKTRKAPTIITPHFAEFSRFIGVELNELQQNPLKYIKKFVDDTNCALILKGHCTYLAFPDGNIYINHVPNGGLSKGGSGDTLSGILGGLLSQAYHVYKSRHKSELIRENSEFYQSLCLGVYLHSTAALLSAEEVSIYSMRPEDVVNKLGTVFQEIENFFPSKNRADRGFLE